MSEGAALRKSLGPFTLWGLGVGYVISGEYFGWNLGLPEGGSYGMLIAIALVSVMYVGIALGYAELACRYPRAGGAFVYARAAFSPRVAAIAGLAQSIEFVFAPPAIALAIGAYASQRFPGLSPALPAMVAYVVFTALNAWGVQQAALFELLVTLLAVFELVLFAGITLPHFDLTRFTDDAFPNGARGVFACLPFAIWFFLGIEGLANAAEEARHPDRDLPFAFISALATLLLLASAVFFGALGVAGSAGVTFAPGSDVASDAPLPLALAYVVAKDSALYELLLGIGVLGLVASFHGILLAAGRTTMELGKVGLLPTRFSAVHAGSGTPRVALFANMLVGIVAIVSGHTDDVISLAVMGALVAYLSSLGALFRLRAREKSAELAHYSGFRTPLFPGLPYLSFGIALVCVVAIGITHPGAAAVLVGLIALGSLRTWAP